MSQSHRFSLRASKQQRVCQGGSSTDSNVGNFPVLDGMALSLLQLTPKSVREPHWTINADQLSYCLKGMCFVTIFGHGNAHDSFIISAGDLFFVPKGFIYSVENMGETDLEIVECFNHEKPEYIDLSAGIAVFPTNVLAETFKTQESFFTSLQKNKNGVFISQCNTAINPPLSYMTSRYKLSLESINPLVVAKGGVVRLCNNFFLPAIHGVTAYSVLLNPKGAREPHWHPNAHELNYLITGTARVSLVAPGGKYEEFEMQAGDASFLPRGQLHHLENIGDDDARFIVFFNHEAPMDIGISGTFGAFSNEVLASLFGVAPSYFKDLNKYQTDLFVVGGG